MQGHINPVVRSQSAQVSVDHVGEVRNLHVACAASGTNRLTFTWQPPEGADAGQNNLLAGYRIYLAGVETPVELERMALSRMATALLPAHGYPFRIATVDKDGRESDGASLLAATLTPNPTATAAYSFYGTTRVSWERVQPEELIGSFEVFMAETAFLSVAGMTPVRTTRGNSADFPGLTEGKPYYSAVVTKSIAGCTSTNLPVRMVSDTPSETKPAVLHSGGCPNGVFRRVVHGPVGADYVWLGSATLASPLANWARLRTNTPLALPITVTVTKVPAASQFCRVLVE